jgi:hypothetical protein
MIQFNWKMYSKFVKIYNTNQREQDKLLLGYVVEGDNV